MTISVHNPFSGPFLTKNKPRTNQRGDSGFSLIELLIVLTVLGILAVFAAPTLMTIRSTSLAASGAEFGGFLNLCRSKAIAERTSIRVGVVTGATNKQDVYRKYGGWKWDKRSSSYLRFLEWKFLPPDVEFESGVPGYVADSIYAKVENSVIEGDYVLATGFQNAVKEEASDGQMLTIQFLTFSPAGRAYIEGGEKRNLIFVVRGAAQSNKQVVNNWYQFTVDTLTGRARVYQP